TQQDIKLLAEGGVFVAHNPQSNLKLGSGVAPVPQMLAEGIPVCLGTDGAASNNNLDLLEETRTAALLHKGVNMNPTLMPAGDALIMATINGAQALGFRDTGCLNVGNKADLILMDFRQAHLTPLWDTLSHVVYSSSAFDIKTMIVDGRLIMDKGEILTLDEEEVYFEINRRFRRFEDK
ncbi:MAG TPA: amidohydrolase family protein, partial [Clostridia bacterium]|nr:amidohydrolase family protein [Clostridia bacterium]